MIAHVLYWQIKKVFPSLYYVSLFKYVLIQIPEAQTMHTLVCKQLIFWVNYNKEYKNHSLNTSEHNAESKKKANVLPLQFYFNAVFHVSNERTCNIGLHLITVTLLHLELPF